MAYFIVAVKHLGAEKPAHIERHKTEGNAKYRAEVIKQTARSSGWNVQVAVLQIDGELTLA